jgi:peptidoglycan DL-endopeptidase CwlO
VSKVDGPGIAAIGVGVIFLYGGVKGYSPLVAFQNLIKGKNPNEGQNATPLTASNPSQPNSGVGVFNGTVSASGNQKIAQQLAIQMGHGDWTTGKIWSDWVALWNGESGWRETANNPSSGAYGIPQALPASKMASAGSDWRTNPATQIKWGIEYIASTYGNPSNAYAKWLSRSPHWY